MQQKLNLDLFQKSLIQFFEKHQNSIISISIIIKKSIFLIYKTNLSNFLFRLRMNNPIN
jgi:hypothetical protein